ncbi:MAG: biotin synthase BioB [Candidatus Omnitrophota bacterium]
MADDRPLYEFLHEITARILDGGFITKEEALQIGSLDRNDALLLFHHAQKIRRLFRGEKVSLCSIVNAKSGACPEDCAFCAQSALFSTGAPVYGIMTPDEVVERAREAKADGAESFAPVISGRGVRHRKELETLGEMIRRILGETGMEAHGSFGILSREQLQYLRECGVTEINHNLETSERFFPSICTTHTYQERLETLRAMREAGIKLCSGGIFGLGETLEDRVDLALTLRELNVDTVPMNFLHPIPGTPLANAAPLPPLTCLITIALYRFMLPKQEIKICGGRDKNLRDLQSMIFFAGADSMMIGNYLTTAGRDPKQDWQMLRDLELDGGR